MGTTMELAAFATAILLAMVVSALAGAFWSQARLSTGARDPGLAERLEALSRALEVLVSKPETIQTLAREAGRGSVEPASDRPIVRMDRPEIGAAAGPTLIAVPDLTRASASSAPVEAFQEWARRFSHVWALDDLGRSIEAIARETAQPIGHVELILGLRRRIGRNRAEQSSTGGGR